MAATVNLNNEPITVDTGKDNVSIVKVISTVRGGRALDVTGFVPEVINACHPIIEETSSGICKPLPVVLSGKIVTKGAHVPGSGYTNNGTYNGVALTGGSGTGATANIVVAANAVSSVTIVNQGTGYKSGDILSAAAANIGTTGSGFMFSVTSVDNTGTVYGAKPAGHTYKGALIASILTSKPEAAIMRIGVINPAAAPYDFATIASAFKTDVPLIDQLKD
jgi:hypothetical protein